MFVFTSIHVISKTMASNEEINLLKCEICKNMLDNPRSLSCLHSFCENCLASSIGKYGSKNDNGISCQICQTVTQIFADGNLDSKDPVECLPKNNFISSLVEREKITSSKGQDNFCQPCFEEDGVKEEGSHWCQQCSGVLCHNCAKFHKKVKNLAGHRVYAINNLKEHPEIISKAYELCETHTEEKFESFCYSHDEPCCVRCMVYKHRHCEDVVPIEQWVKETQNALGPSELLQELDRKLTEVSINKIDPVQYLNEEITKMRTDIDNHLNKLEKILREEVGMFAANIEHTSSINTGKINYYRMYLQKLITSGTTIQLLTDMKRIRYLLANTNNNGDSEEPTCYIEFDQQLQTFKNCTKSFGYIVSEKRKPGVQAELSVNPSNINECEPIISSKQECKKKGERKVPVPTQRKGNRAQDTVISQPKNRIQVDDNENRNGEKVFGIDNNDEQLETTYSPKSPGPRIQLSKTVDNIAEIEKKLKIFIDNHITKVHDVDVKWQETDDSKERKRSGRKKDTPRNNSYNTYGEDNEQLLVESDVFECMDDESSECAIYKDSNGSINKDNPNKRRSKRRSADDKNRARATRRQKSIDSSNDNGEVRLRQKRQNKKKKTDPLDPEKEKLNALITNYLMKSENKEKNSSLSKTKSFYFSTPDIPSSIMENERIGTVFEDKELAIETGRSMRRRNSLHATTDDFMDPLYEIIDYERLRPFIVTQCSQIDSKTNVNNEDNETKETESLAETDMSNNTSQTKGDNSEFQTPVPVADDNSDYRIYSPQSQLKDSDSISEKSIQMSEKGKPTPKLRFLEKAKRKFRFHKKNGKFDVEQAEKRKDRDMNEPVYVGTAYEKTVRKACHEVPMNKPKNDSPYEQNFQVIYPEKQQLEEKKSEDIQKETDADEYARIEDVAKNENEKPKEFVPLEQKIDSNVEREQTSPGETVQGVEMKPSIPKGVPGGMLQPSFFSELKLRLEAKQTTEVDQKMSNLEDNDPKPNNNGSNSNTKEIVKPKQNVLPVSPKPRKRDRDNSNENLTPKANVQETDGNTESKVGISEKKMICYETSLVNDFNVQSGDTLITGGVINNKGKLFLIDKNEKKLYIFKCDADCEDVLKFKDKPYDLAIVNDHLVAVTFPNSESIDLVDLGDMSIVKSLSVNEACFGIDHQNKTFVVRCSESIKIINLHGEIQNSIRVQTDFYGYIACRGERIYYTYKSSLICINDKGDQIFIFENPDLERAEGLAVDFEGNVYVAGMDSNNIWQISGIDGKQNRKIISELESPKTIAFSESLNRFFVVYASTSIVIYDMDSHYGSAC